MSNKSEENKGMKRIYQGRIIRASFCGRGSQRGEGAALRALVQTHRLFQDAVNYHLVALAGMADVQNATEGGRFREQVKAIWSEYPKGCADACTLQVSVCRTLGLGLVSFEQAVNAIFDGCERPDVLPYVQQFVIDKVRKEKNPIRDGGNELLPKLCDAESKANYDYSSKSRLAGAGEIRLRRLLNGSPTEEELSSFAREMDLSWAGVKTQPGMFWSESETCSQLKRTMEDLLRNLDAGGVPVWQRMVGERNLGQEVRETLARREADDSHLLARNNRCNLALKQAAIFFMYYPCSLSAALLKAVMPAEKKAASSDAIYDYTSLEDDPLLLARGKRGYVYPGFTALPIWATQKEGDMYDKDWDILAFKEALKALHGFSLKTAERQQERRGLEDEINYMKTGKEMKAEKARLSDAEDEDSSLPVLGGDPRYELLCELVKSLRQGEEDQDYGISRRAIKGWDKMVRRWNELIRKGKGDTRSLQEAVKKQQGKEDSWGSTPLFLALCEEKYRPIWQGGAPSDQYHRSKHILEGFNTLQEKERKLHRLEKPVRLTAAEPVFSPRALTYSDLTTEVNRLKGCSFDKSEEGMVQLRVAVQDECGLWREEAVQVVYSAPRLVRDQLGINPSRWGVGKEKTSNVVWLQPMLAALELEQSPRPKEGKKNPSVMLEVDEENRAWRSRQGGKESAERCEAELPACWLNFAVTLDVEPLQRALGIAARWQKQMLDAKEKPHLQWPGTVEKKASEGWWNRPEIQKEGFQAMSVDLSVRYAAAWSLIQVDAFREKEPVPEPPRRLLGEAGGRRWYGHPVQQGILRLDGEFPARRGGENSGVIRRATESEEKRMLALWKSWGMEPPSEEERAQMNILQWNDAVLRVFRRMLSRYRVYLHACHLLKEETDAGKVEKEMTRLAEYVERMKQDDFTSGISEALRRRHREDALTLLFSEIERLRVFLPRMAETVTNLLLPRRRGRWEWSAREGDSGYGIMKPEGEETYEREHYIHRMGGLSVARLSQLENLRQRLQSMNRLLALEPGQKPKTGRELRDDPVPDPCPDIRLKIENVRETRVNQIAHGIVAQALGVELITPPRAGKNRDGRDVVHGEYRRIPGRKPVSMVVLENLSAYRTQVDHSRRENTTLMRWAHRQIAAKVVQLLEEVFGIPVLFTRAAYTSRFDSMTSAPGFRADAMTGARLKRRRGDGEEEECRCYDDLLSRLPHQVKLYMPSLTNSGEFFISRKPGGEPVVRNADINASVNIAWRALASPEALHLLHQVRLKRDSEKVSPRRDYKREKAVKHLPFKLLREPDTKEKKFPVFVCSGEDASLAMAMLGDTPLMEKREFDQRESWLLCHQLNRRILQKVGIETPELEKLEARIAELEDDIPL